MERIWQVSPEQQACGWLVVGLGALEQSLVKHFQNNVEGLEPICHNATFL